MLRSGSANKNSKATLVPSPSGWLVEVSRIENGAMDSAIIVSAGLCLSGRTTNPNVSDPVCAMH